MAKKSELDWIYENSVNEKCWSLYTKRATHFDSTTPKGSKIITALGTSLPTDDLMPFLDPDRIIKVVLAYTMSAGQYSHDIER